MANAVVMLMHLSAYSYWFTKLVYSSGSGFPVHLGGFLQNTTIDPEHTNEQAQTANVHSSILLARSLAHLEGLPRPSNKVFETY